MRNRSLLLLVASNRRRGAEVFGDRLAIGLRDRGWDVDFVAVQAADTDRVVPAEPLAPATRSGRLNLQTVRELRQRVKKTNPSIVLANGGATLRYAVTSLTAIRNRPILAYGSIGEPRFWLRSPRHRVLQRFFQNQADLVLAVSAETRRQLIEELSIPADRIKVAPTGVPPDFFITPTPSDDEALRLLFLGSLSPEKDPLSAVEVAAQIGGGSVIRFVGAGPLEAQARQAAEAGRVALELTGSVEDVIPHLAWADLLVLTSQTEGLPGAVLEAGAAGVPALAFDVGGTRETMVPGETGLLARPGDIAGLASLGRKLASDREELVAMGRRQQDYIADNYTLAAAIARFDDYLTEELTR